MLPGPARDVRHRALYGGCIVVVGVVLPAEERASVVLAKHGVTVVPDLAGTHGPVTAVAADAAGAVAAVDHVEAHDQAEALLLCRRRLGRDQRPRVTLAGSVLEPPRVQVSIGDGRALEPARYHPHQRRHLGPQLFAVGRHLLHCLLRDHLAAPTRGAMRLVDQVMTDDGAVVDIGSEIDVAIATHQGLPLGQTEGAVAVLYIRVLTLAQLDHHSAALGPSRGEPGQNV